MAPRFRLERVLRLRGQLRQRAQEEVARRRAALDTLGEAVEEARAAQDAARAAEAVTARRGLTGAELLVFRAYDASARAREEWLARERARLGEELRVWRDTLLGRRREERQLERLRDRATARHEADEERAAMALLDDLVRTRRK